MRDQIEFTSAYYELVEGPYKPQLAKVGEGNGIKTVGEGKEGGSTGVIEKVFAWEYLQRYMPSFWSKILDIRNNPYSTDDAAVKPIVQAYFNRVVMLCYYASISTDEILKEGSDNLKQLENWMGDIINFESASVSEYSYIVRTAVDCISRGDPLPELRLAYTQSIEDTEVSRTILDGQGGGGD